MTGDEGIYVSEVDEVDGPDGTVYRARLKSHPHVSTTASSPDQALRALAVMREDVNKQRASIGVPPLKCDMVNPDTEVRSTTLTGRLHK